eukprot:2173578-Prorocentrum_lima.AAC.1
MGCSTCARDDHFETPGSGALTGAETPISRQKPKDKVPALIRFPPGSSQRDASGSCGRTLS